MFSTSSMPSDRDFAYRNGASFVTKPIDHKQVALLADVFLQHCSDEVKVFIEKKKG